MGLVLEPVLRLAQISMPLWFFVLVISLLGIAFGSFINVLVFRTKTKDAWWKGRSKCRSCLEPVAAIDLIPILSYFAIRGRCRHCQTVLSAQYPIVEAVTGILFGLLFVRASLFFGMPDFIAAGEWFTVFVRDAILAVFLMVIFIYDLRYGYILDRFTIPAMVIALVFNLVLGADPLEYLLAGLMIGGFFAIQYVVSKGTWIGGGDIRLGMVMGFYLGLEHGVLALFLSYLLGAFIGVILIATKKRSMKSSVPFGTFLALGTVIAAIFGDIILDWYLGYFSF